MFALKTLAPFCAMAASRLPRSQQQKITALLEPLTAHHAGR